MTDESLSMERKVADMLCQRHGAVSIKMPEYECFDFILEKEDRTFALLEVQSRSQSFMMYDPVYVNKGKPERLLDMERSFGVQALYFMIWDRRVVVSIKPGLIVLCNIETSNDKRLKYMVPCSMFTIEHVFPVV